MKDLPKGSKGSSGEEAYPIAGELRSLGEDDPPGCIFPGDTDDLLPVREVRVAHRKTAAISRDGNSGIGYEETGGGLESLARIESAPVGTGR